MIHKQNTGQYPLSYRTVTSTSVTSPKYTKKSASICENQHQGQVFLLSCKSTVIIELRLYMYTQRSHCLEDNQKSALSYKE